MDTKEFKTIVDKNDNYITIIKNGVKDYEIAHTLVPELFPMVATLEGIDNYHHNLLIDKFIKLGCKLKSLSIS